MKRLFEFLLLNIAVATFYSCNIDEEITVGLPPKIILDSETGIYTVKQGREITISPTYEPAEKTATYSWTMNGEVIGTSPSLSFIQNTTGEYYIAISVSNENGTNREEIRIDVVELEIPTVSINSNKTLTTVIGEKLLFNASIRQTSLHTTCVWSINNEKAGEGESFNFIAEESGFYTIVATANNEDGSHSDTIFIEVLDIENAPLIWDFEQTEFHTTVGRRLLITPTVTIKKAEIEYTWSIIGKEETICTEPEFVFTGEREGVYKIHATASEKEGYNASKQSHTFTITVYPEDKFHRESNSNSSKGFNKVYEYTPAPGQFINDLKTSGFNGTQTTAESACKYAEERLLDNNWISLGGFGGYVIVGFDHSITNNKEYDIAIACNAFDNSSEPAIVWVMQDENGDGKPNDTWYELAGSETEKEGTIRGYKVTYYRPTGAGMPVQWQDNRGEIGTVDYQPQFHSQDYYYPIWIETESYTLKGTRLKARNYDKSGNGSYWVNPNYDWGYADNYSSIDFIKGEMLNLFDIDNAIDYEGKRIKLNSIDFVKVQSAINAKSGWLGEISTEVCGFYDYNLKSK